MEVARSTASKSDSTVGIGYIRVSKDDQTLSPEGQAKAIETYAASQGITLVAMCLDLGVCSADELGDRPGLTQAIDLVRSNHAGVLVVAKRDRLARDVYVTASVERVLSQGGCAVQSAAGEGNGSTPADQFLRTVVDGAAQYERALIRARTKSALAVKKSRNEKTGGRCPYGFTLDADGVHLVPVPEEQNIIARAKARRGDGLSYAKVADALTAEGFRSRVGQPFKPMQVARMIPG